MTEEELEILREKLAYLAQRAEFVVLAGSLPRAVDPGFYGELVRELNRGQLLAVVDAEGEPLRLAVEAEPYLVSPEPARGGGARRPRVRRRRGSRRRASTRSPRSARATSSSRSRPGCYALLREDRTELRVRAQAPRIEAISEVGAGDTLLAGFLAARVAGKPFDEAVRAAVAAGAASVLEAGAGRFDPREASRLASLVQLEHARAALPHER